MRQSITWFAVLAVSLLLLVACEDGDGDTDQPTTAPVTTESAAPPPSVEPPVPCDFALIEGPHQGTVTAPSVPLPTRLGEPTDEASADVYLYQGESFLAARIANCEGVKYLLVVPDEWLFPEVVPVRLAGNTTLG